MRVKPQTPEPGRRTRRSAALSYRTALLLILSCGVSLPTMAQEGVPPQPSASQTSVNQSGTSQTSAQQDASPAATLGPASNNSGPRGTSGIATPPPPNANQGATPDPGDIGDLLGIKPLPNKPMSLIGGRVTKVDPIRDHLTIRIFGPKGGKKMDVAFDDRSRIFRNGVQANPSALKKGDRVYLDTELYNDKVFAKNIYVKTGGSDADTHGQVMAYDPGRGVLTVHDELSGENLAVTLSPQTSIVGRGQPASRAALAPGALVTIDMDASTPGRPVAREVDVLASPGSTFTFFGAISHIDLRNNVIAIENNSDKKTYEIALANRDQLPTEARVGSVATVTATFEGPKYTARSIQLERSPRREADAEQP